MTDDDRLTAIEAAYAGGGILRGARPRQVTPKSSPTDVVTDVDKAVQDAIVESLQRSHPDDGILAEEDLRIESSNGRLWVIDPIDGTANFVRDMWPAVVSVGLQVDGVYTAGAIFDPVHTEMYSAGQSSGSFCNEEPLARKHDMTDLGHALVAISGAEERNGGNRRSRVLHELTLEADSVRELGSSALHLCFVANSRFDANVVFGIQPWDVAAGFVIAREAGCVVEGVESGVDATHDAALIAPPELMDELRDLVQRALCP